MSTRRRNEYKLYYFNTKGRAELARLILAYAKVPYDDIRYEREDWPKHKDRMPNGQLPVLEWKGQLLPESLAIARFLARRHNLAGTDEWQWAKIDAMTDTIYDTLGEAKLIFMAGEDEEKKKEAVGNFSKNAIEPLFKRLDKMLEDNGTDYLIGNQCSMADLALFSCYDFAVALCGDRLPKCQHVAALHARVGQIPSIKAWIEKRPVTPF
ncbi:hematopoietic prostaglandin D synthase-like [Daphnia carinata]|uniref:hematopoietic prostaglandin D synthase-like n=1 Tax=Daphnia carinata TaxID=120202 RepID=UPI00257A39CC|nr:hematopoietic prostaglandin D synthase-like [Daphnia carinata]